VALAGLIGKKGQMINDMQVFKKVPVGGKTQDLDSVA
jgi:hypothetical protein